MPNSTAKFYYRSYIDQDLDGYSLSGDLTPTTNINDRRKNTYATSDETGTGDGTSEEFIADMLTERTVDTIFLKSNFKTFTVYTWNGSDYDTAATYTSNTSDFLEISITSATTSKIKIACTHTITADEEKKIYLCDITSYIGELYIEDIDIKQKHEFEDYKNIYGGSIKIVKYPNRGKVEIDLGWSNMSTTDYATYTTLKAAFLLDALLIYVYYSTTYDLLDDEALYLVNDLEHKDNSPASQTLSAGINTDMELLEC